MTKWIIWICASVLMVACSQEEWIKKVAPADQQEIVRHFIEQLRNRNFADIERAADQSIAADLNDGILENMADAIPKGDLTSVKLVGATSFSSSQEGKTLNISYEFQFGEKFVVINVARKLKGAADTIVGFRVQPIPARLSN